VLELLNSSGVLTVPGSGFGREFGGDHFRIVYLPGEEILQDAMDKLESFLSKSSK
jgi:aspartate/methionine/tyrosine aminotransferase